MNYDSRLTTSNSPLTSYKTFLLFTIIFLSSCVFKGPDDLSKTKADFEMTAIQLFEAFESDENAANEMYLNKIIEVSGTVSEINEKSIIIGEGMTLANCAFSEKEIVKIKDAEVGQSIIIKGACSGFNMFDVALSKCVIVKSQ